MKATDTFPYNMVVTVSELNVRKKPGMQYEIVGLMLKGNKETIVEEKDGWGKLECGGWVCLRFTEKIN